MDIYLASKSIRRQQLLKQIGVKFKILDAEINEIGLPNESPAEMVLRLAKEKAEAGLTICEVNKPILSADTCISINNHIIGKPSTKDEALSILTLLSGQWHYVYSAVVITNGLKTESALSQSKVCFREITPAEMLKYWQTHEPKDKAGAYAIQGLGAIFVKHLEGSYSGVMGLPLYETAVLLNKFGVDVL